MLIVGTANTASGIMDGLATLIAGRSAIDAVETALRAVESDPEDDSVGLGGLPNLLGDVELDASIMEGTTLKAGAVGALKGFLHPISVARKVMESLPHVLLMGEGAALFAEEVGAEQGELLTETATQKYREFLPVGVVERGEPQRPLYQMLRESIHRRPGGTANVIAQDGEGRICCGVTTSGWAFKYPGRLGDSPVIGAGNYADDRYGAAACTGLGEVAIRLCSAYSVVARLAAGQLLDHAASAAMQDVLSLPIDMPFTLNILAMDSRGRHVLQSTDAADKFYLVAYPGDAEPRRLAATGVY